MENWLLIVADVLAIIGVIAVLNADIWWRPGWIPKHPFKFSDLQREGVDERAAIGGKRDGR